MAQIERERRASRKIRRDLCNAELHSFSSLFLFRISPFGSLVMLWWCGGRLALYRNRLACHHHHHHLHHHHHGAPSRFFYHFLYFFFSFLSAWKCKRKRQIVRRERKKRSRATPLRFVRVAFPSESLSSLYCISIPMGYKKIMGTRG